MTDTRKRYKANSIFKYQVLLFNYNNDYIDITRLVNEFNVYEDLFNSTIKADFLIEDALALTERFPLVGNEKIYIQFATDDSLKPIKFTLDVYKIAPHSILEERSHTYIIHAVDPVQIRNMTSVVEKAYKFQPIESIVSAVYGEYLQETLPLSVEQSLFEGTTFGLRSFIGANQRPIHFINMLAREAQSKDYPESSLYFFYQDADGFKFKSLGTMIDKETPAPPGRKFVYGQQDHDEIRGTLTKAGNSGEVQQFEIIGGLTIQEDFDLLRNIDMGYYNSELTTFDPLTRQVSIEDKLLDDEFDKIPHLPQGKRTFYQQGKYYRATDSYRRTIQSVIAPSSLDVKTFGYYNGRIDENNDPYFVGRRRQQYFFHNTQSMKNIFGNYSVNVTVPGDSTARVGTAWRMWIPQHSSIKEDVNKYLRHFGREEATFLATAVRHHYKQTSGDYLTHINLVKESFQRPIKADDITTEEVEVFEN